MKKSLFQVNLSGVLKVLSDHLYSRKEVFIRELLQNSVDAITARKLVERFDPLVQVDYYFSGEGAGLVISDNGIGLTEEEVEEFLSRIGSSSKSAEQLAEQRKTFIGQFGIGLLSCFMVSDEILVLSESVKADYAVKWLGSADGSYTVQRTEATGKKGTKVILRFREDVNITEKKFWANIRLYGQFLEVPIRVDINSENKGYINKQFPWERDANGDEVLALGREIFQENFSQFIRLEDRESGTNGIAYIIPHQTHPGSVQSQHVYIRRMFVTERSSSILPEWAFFVKAVINSDGISPTASREDIYLNPASNKMKEQLGACIRKYLLDLSVSSPASLQQILSVHGSALKELCLHDTDFLRFIYKFFVFPTTLGEMSLARIHEKTRSVTYMSDLDEFRQTIPIANANQSLIVNAGYHYDAALFAAIAGIDPDHTYLHINAEHFGNVLQEVDPDELQVLAGRVEMLQSHLDRFECKIQLKDFQPAVIPAIFHLPPEKFVHRDLGKIKEESDDLWKFVSDDLRDERPQVTSSLFLNVSNAVVKRLLYANDFSSDKILVEILLVNAMLMGHYPLNQEEMNCMNENTLHLVENTLNNNGK